MKDLPSPEDYEKEMKYLPCGATIKHVIEVVCAEAHKCAQVADLMCGTGYLLGRIRSQRPDLKLHGIDIDNSMIEYASANHPEIEFTLADVLDWDPERKYDIITCTGALHHLAYADQGPLIERIPDMTKPEGIFILSDSYISDYYSERERRLNSLELGCEYIKEAINNEAPAEVIRACIDIMYNDIMRFEYKTSKNNTYKYLARIFGKIDLHEVWPEKNDGFGDAYFICTE
ncbi:methyltransferase domain-containing protein [Candidatus Woesearchaeota archaeon]|nr:methyltransferase domain-containing protein [Candidatus Woesearchaeota archaeon]